MIFATDLDGTMMYSHRRISENDRAFCCVEYYNNRAITYMTLTAIQKLKFLMDNIVVIPVTTRSISQFKRIDLFSNTEYSIVDNGGIIFHNGVMDAKWNNYINDIMKKYDIRKTYDIFSNLPTLISPPRIVDEKFVFARTGNLEECKRILESKLDTKIWQLSFQGEKAYAIPTEINKGNALKYISENLITEEHIIASAGDSNLDISMLEYSNYGIIPSNCSIKPNNNRFIEIGTGIYSADSILDFIINLSQK